MKRWEPEICGGVIIMPYYVDRMKYKCKHIILVIQRLLNFTSSYIIAKSVELLLLNKIWSDYKSLCSSSSDISLLLCINPNTSLSLL